MITNKKLLQEIEALRRKMIYLGVKKGLTSSEVIQISQKLDQLLNMYHNKESTQSSIEQK